MQKCLEIKRDEIFSYIIFFQPQVFWFLHVKSNNLAKLKYHSCPGQWFKSDTL